jgi:hypothetical protein
MARAAKARRAPADDPDREVHAAMDRKYYASVLVAEPGAASPRQYNGVITLQDRERVADVADAVGAAVCRSLGVAREQVRVVHCLRMH